jgi:hypothetical protein
MKGLRRPEQIGEWVFRTALIEKTAFMTAGLREKVRAEIGLKVRQNGLLAAAHPREGV